MIKTPANAERSFGLSVGTMFLLIAGYMLWRGRVVPAEMLGGIGAILVLLGAVRPAWLRRPSALWWQLAGILGFINARIILTVIFVTVLTPIGVIWRLIRRDPLNRRRASWPGWSPYPSRYRDTAHYKRMY